MEWKDPPPNHGNSKDDWAAVATELKEHPGRWALIRHYDDKARAATIATRIKHGHSAPFRPRFSFEARATQGDVYARYIGEPK